MQRVRRLSLVAVLAVAGLFGMSACRSQPNVAAYVGDKVITVDQVDAVADEYLAQNPQAKSATGFMRQRVLSMMVFVEVAKRYAEEKHLGALAQDPAADVAAQGSLWPGYDTLDLTATLYESLLSNAVNQSQMSDDDYREVARTMAGQPVNDEVLAQLRPILQRAQGLPLAVSLRKEIDGKIGGYRIDVNPRYQSLDFIMFIVQMPDGRNYPAVKVTLDPGRDQSVTGATGAL
jgi:hypothetical protein